MNLIKEIYQVHPNELIGFCATIGIIILMFWFMNYYEWHLLTGGGVPIDEPGMLKFKEICLERGGTFVQSINKQGFVDIYSCKDGNYGYYLDSTI